MGKKTPDSAKLFRTRIAAPYTRTAPNADKDLPVAKTDKPEAKTEKKADAKVDMSKLSDGKVDSKFDDVKSGATPVETGAPKPGEGPKSATHNEAPVPIEPIAAAPAPAPAAVEPEPTPRAHQPTVGMPVIAPVGAPPEMPMTPMPSAVESPTHMPGPRAIPDGSPTDLALPPGVVPPGDSRSFRRGNEFALVYRQSTAVITRFGTIGQRGQWRVVEYPTSSSASNSYAKECSRFVGEGFSDYRE